MRYRVIRHFCDLLGNRFIRGFTASSLTNNKSCHRKIVIVCFTKDDEICLPKGMAPDKTPFSN